MVKIEKLNDSAKAVFMRMGTQQPVFLNAILTDSEFETLKVLSGAVVVSINESEVRVVPAEPGAITAVFTDTIAAEATSVDAKVGLTEATAAAETQEVLVADKAPTIVKPVPRARK